MQLMELKATVEELPSILAEPRRAEWVEAPTVDLDADFDVYDAYHPDGVVFKHRRRPIFVKEFSRIEGVEEAHVRELVRLNLRLVRNSLCVVGISAVRIPERGWGVGMADVAGRPLADVINELNPEWYVWNSEASRLQDAALAMLPKINEVTGGLCGRRGRWDGRDIFDDFENFIFTPAGQVMNVNPIDMSSLVKRMFLFNPAGIAQSLFGGRQLSLN